MSCPNKVSQFVPRGWTYKEFVLPCGSTGIDGLPLFCDNCARLYANRDWRAEAEENGERIDDDY